MRLRLQLPKAMKARKACYEPIVSSSANHRGYKVEPVFLLACFLPSVLGQSTLNSLLASKPQYI